VFRNGVLDKITKDDNSTAELMEKGVLLAEEKHLLNTPAFLTQYVGKEKCQFSVGRFELDKTKYMFLVTDGFKDRVIREEMQEIALKYDSLSEVMCELEKIMKNPEKMAKKVRELAKSKDPLYVLSLNTVKEDLLRDDATVVGMQILEVIENDR
jgi:serine/threonine protein phosphatase PrpC